jgi:hypothetical protein
MVLNSIKSRPDKFAKSLFKGHHLSRRERLRRLDTIMEIAPTLIATQIPMFRVLISGLKQQLPKKIPQALKEGHIKAMTRNPLPQARVDFARALKWFLLVRQNGHFILGDVGVANKVGPNGELKSLPDITDDIVRTWLPISDTHLIVGVKGSAVIGEEVENINLETAALSSDFFVSRTTTDREKSYAVVLGTQSRLFSDEQLQETVSEVLAESALF